MQVHGHPLRPPQKTHQTREARDHWAVWLQQCRLPQNDEGNSGHVWGPYQPLACAPQTWKYMSVKDTLRFLRVWATQTSQGTSRDCWHLQAEPECLEWRQPVVSQSASRRGRFTKNSVSEWEVGSVCVCRWRSSSKMISANWSPWQSWAEGSVSRSEGERGCSGGMGQWGG